MIEKKPHIVNISDSKTHDSLVCGIDAGSDCDDCLADRWLSVANVLNGDPERRERVLALIEQKILDGTGVNSQ